MDNLKSDTILQLPPGWEDGTFYTFTGPEAGGVQHTLTIVLDRKLNHDNLEDFAREKIDPMISSMQSIDVLKDEPKTLASGKEAWELVYKWVPVKDTVRFQKYIFLIIDGIGYTCSAMFTKQTFKTLAVQVDQMIDTLGSG